jgi:cell division septation protein DedD
MVSRSSSAREARLIASRTSAGAVREPRSVAPRSVCSSVDSVAAWLLASWARTRSRSRLIARENARVPPGGSSSIRRARAAASMATSLTASSSGAPMSSLAREPITSQTVHPPVVADQAAVVRPSTMSGTGTRSTVPSGAAPASATIRDHSIAARGSRRLEAVAI